MPTTAAQSRSLARYATKTLHLKEALVEHPGQTARWYADRVGSTRLVMQKLLSRMHHEGLCTARVAPELLYNTKRWYPSDTLCKLAFEGALVMNTQVRLMQVLADTPWLTCHELTQVIPATKQNVWRALGVLRLRGEIRRDTRTSPYRWALADEPLPRRLAEAS